ncbi:molybdenum cofactor guanylyltransferase [Saccharospirillum sp.]|uniref:molybdenum cofactor guanylyltransferase n=1 Tax=Saccharospirillum sp. TaxID=2033801 RepID=UPI00349FEC21
MVKQGAVLILAGGRSLRMGTDKARLPMADTTLLDWQRQRLASLDLDVWHSGPGGIVDVWPDFRGPLAGLYSALTQHPEPAFWLVVPVDMPALPLDRLCRLAHCMEAESVPVAYQNAPLPLAVPAIATVRETLADWLNQPDGPRSLRALMAHFNGRWLAEPLAEQDRLNLNTPEDWAEFQAVSEVSSSFSDTPTGDTGE